MVNTCVIFTNKIIATQEETATFLNDIHHFKCTKPRLTLLPQPAV